MFNLARQCRNSLIPISQTLTGNSMVRTYHNYPRKKQFFSSLLKKHIQSYSGSTSLTRKGQKIIGVWLATCSGMIFVDVVVDEVVRLTSSGVSTTWKLPKSEEEWKEIFQKYNKEMSLSEFKRIWYMEYAQKLYAGTFACVYFLPAALFWAKGWFNGGMKKRAVFWGTLTAFHCWLSWRIVKDNEISKISQYSLVGDLSLSLFLYSLFLRGALHQFLPPETLNVTSQALKAAKKFQRLAHYSKGFIYITAISGALVAGLNAGLVYNSFPKMADRWIPSDILAFSPKIINFTENPTTVQFEHRILGTSTLVYVTFLYFLSKRRILPPRAYKAALVLTTLGWLQVALGITTLLHYVPVSLAAFHQSGSVLLLSAAMWLTHELKRIPK